MTETTLSTCGSGMDDYDSRCMLTFNMQIAGSHIFLFVSAGT